MPEVTINGPEGRIEGRYRHSGVENAPIALILHPHPDHGGTYGPENGFLEVQTPHFDCRDPIQTYSHFFAYVISLAAAP